MDLRTPSLPATSEGPPKRASACAHERPVVHPVVHTLCIMSNHVHHEQPCAP